MNFVDVSKDDGLKRVTWAPTAPRWRQAQHGMCLEGKCRKSGCEAFDQKVIIPIGYRKFDLLRDTDTISVCPLCKQYVDPITCSFNNCWWKYSGKKKERRADGKPPVPCNSDWKQADDAYHYFDQIASGEVIWLDLVFEVVKDKPQQ
ncbi:unnamed protein product [Rotaria sordida]|uniref:Uncharacterized protein n=1 Tax=Rotaria sordida TaxID=392033 RepID=A0A819Z0Q7_9BILA|nr:unnamed protein product [Rotaria sordida]CAF1549347.1 unnamed protein product [Rotaria sordida]CAF4166709.1 unnamed protein product [Rotaria sordida]CAF4215514.1 unnamed protein product [Rotaria sordida]